MSLYTPRSLPRLTWLTSIEHTRPPRIQYFSTSRKVYQGQQHRKERFGTRLRTALNATPIKWRPIPISLGIAVVGGVHLYRTQARERERIEQALDEQYEHEHEHEHEHENGNGAEDSNGRKPRKRKRVKPSGPWSVQIMSTLPLKALSRLWGRFNEIPIPYYFRVPGFKLYGWIFGVNFKEIEEEDLHNFKNLSEFFYRTLKPGSRPIDTTYADALLSPADGRIVQFGTIEHGEVEQVKGVTYSVDALLGAKRDRLQTSNVTGSKNAPRPSQGRSKEGEEEIIRADEEFAQVNGISYTLPNLFSGGSSGGHEVHREGGKIRAGPEMAPTDQSTTPRASSEAEVRADLALGPKAPRPWYYPAAQEVPTSLYYCVVYLDPGDYHRYHSPVSWVVEMRRHFAGELYSVSPFLVKNLPGLFTLNERVVLMGRWKYGFFSYTPVGATNVGSIVINFDRELRTNSLLTDTAADRAAELAQERGEPYSGFSEAVYASASPVLKGHALRKGEEMGGFMLGSTIVMVFEAPKGRRPSFDEGWFGDGGEDMRKGGWKWKIQKGQKVKVGQMLGHVDEEGKRPGSLD